MTLEEAAEKSYQEWLASQTRLSLTDPDVKEGFIDGYSIGWKAGTRSAAVD